MTGAPVLLDETLPCGVPPRFPTALDWAKHGDRAAETTEEMRGRCWALPSDGVGRGCMEGSARGRGGSTECRPRPRPVTSSDGGD